MRLGEVCEIIGGGTPSKKKAEYYAGSIPWASVRDMNCTVLSKTEFCITEQAVQESATNVISEGEVVISTHVGLGKVCVLGQDTAINQDLKAVIPVGGMGIDRWYLYYWFVSNAHILIANGKGATVKGVTVEFVKNLQIPLPPLPEQKRIAAILDKICEMKRNAEARLQKLDRLVKARFVEMFEGEKKGRWACATMEELVARPMSNGFFAKRDDYCADGNVSVLGVVNVVNTLYCKIVGLPTTHASETDIKKYSLQWGDMLFCRSSLVKEGIGKASIVPRGLKSNVLFECHVIRASLDLARIEPVFAQVQSTRPYFRNQIIAHSKTATMTTISQGGISCAKMFIPPLALQRQFAAFVEKVEGLKATAKKELEQVDLLYRAKLQEFFG